MKYKIIQDGSSLYVTRLDRRDKKIKKKKNKKLPIEHILIGEKCRSCRHSDETAVSAALKCTMHKPITAFCHGKWVCYSFSRKGL